MGYLVETFFVNKDKKCFTGSMFEIGDQQGAEQMARDEARRIGKELGLLMSEIVVKNKIPFFRIGKNIEIRYKRR